MLEQCVSIVHEDIIAIWNIQDSFSYLGGEDFKARMSHLAGELAHMSQNETAIPTTPGAAVTFAAATANHISAIGAVTEAAKWVSDVYQATPNNIACIMGYIADLIIVLIFLSEIHQIPETALRPIEDDAVNAIKAYISSGLLSEAHKEIRMFVAAGKWYETTERGDGVLKEIVRLVNKFHLHARDWVKNVYQKLPSPTISISNISDVSDEQPVKGESVRSHRLPSVRSRVAPRRSAQEPPPDILTIVEEATRSPTARLSSEGTPHQLCPPSYPELFGSPTHLAIDLRGRNNQFGATRDLEQAIALFREALDLCPRGRPGRPSSLNSLAVAFFTRYQYLGTIEDLDEAIILDREALDLRPHGHRDRLMSLNNLAVDLSARYKQLSRIEDLNEAIIPGQEAFEPRPRRHSDGLMSLDNLATVLSIRYKQFGRIEDLNEAIVLAREVLNLRPQGHPDRLVSLDNLAATLSIRYKQFRRIEDLDKVIVLAGEVLDLRPQGHPDRLMSLDSLAAVLSVRCKQFGRIEDLDEVIVLAREVLDLHPQAHPDRLMSLDNLAAVLSIRYKQFWRIEDLDEAIE
ncbi:hypothetical protein HD554DRAFT_2225151, partial [Boletus coccyginus]